MENREGSAEQQGNPLLVKKDHMDQINEFAAAKFGGFWKLLFFLAAMTTVAAGVLAIIGAFDTLLSPFSFANQGFLCLFGIIMLIIDLPLDNSPALLEARRSICRYLLFMTRFTGRGVWYLYLATMIWGGLYNLGLDPLIGFLMAMGVGAIGICSMIYGIKYSLKLETARKEICQRTPSEVYALCPNNGMKIDDFNRMCQRYGSTTFSPEELTYVATALSLTVNVDDVISKEEFLRWTQGTMTIM